MTIMTDTDSVTSDLAGAGGGDAAHTTRALSSPVANPRRLRLGASGTPLADSGQENDQTAA